MPKIIAITANTAHDYVLEVKKLILGTNLLAENAVEYAGGKGLNVAKAIETLGCSVYALGFVGRQSLTTFTEVKSDLLHVDYTIIEGKTRTNVTLIDVLANTETHVRTPGFSVTETDCQKLIDRIDSQAWKGDIVIMSGSLPAGARSSLYGEIIALCHRKSAVPFLDSSGESLRLGLNHKPFLVKPNQHELEQYVGHPLLNETEIINAAREISRLGVQVVVISRGQEGATAVIGQDVYRFSLATIPSQIRSNVGCGDAMVAGIAFAMSQNQSDLPACIQFGMACATANLFSLEPGRFELQSVAEIMNQIRCENLCSTV